MTYAKYLITFFIISILNAQSDDETFEQATYIEAIPKFELQFTGVITKQVSNKILKDNFLSFGTAKLTPQFKISDKFSLGIPISFTSSNAVNKRIDITKLIKDSTAVLQADNRLRLKQNIIGYGLKFSYANMIKPNFIMQFGLVASHNLFLYSGVPYQQIPNRNYNFSSFGLGGEWTSTYYFADNTGVSFIVGYNYYFTNKLNPANMGFTNNIWDYKNSDLNGKQSAIYFGMQFNFVFKK